LKRWYPITSQQSVTEQICIHASQIRMKKLKVNTTS